VPILDAIQAAFFQPLRQAKAVAQEYYEITGRPLGITGEVAEYEAARLLGVKLAEVRQSGYDAIEESRQGIRTLQIKSRCFSDANRSQRLGSIRLDKEWDAVLMVLLDRNFECREIWEAGRTEIEEALSAPGSISRNERGQLPVNKFKAIGTLRWPRTR